ncbi:MAG: tetratricopeptide repeat protein, partial [Deltaproteobacteria bacterium]|nr:tetratricopeptide repeat protein [Deltaproteobacteria bacterium]
AATGTASVEAWLKAAELYRLAGKPEPQRACLAAAADSDAGVLTYAANTGLAALDLEQGRPDEAIARLQRMMADEDDALAQSAALDLGLALESLGRTDEANRAYTEFATKWPASKHLEQVRARQTRLAVAPPPAPAAPAGAGG